MVVAIPKKRRKPRKTDKHTSKSSKTSNTLSSKARAIKSKKISQVQEKTLPVGIKNVPHKYTHNIKRKNTPPAGLVSSEREIPESKKTYKYDPNLDPKLVWAGKEENSQMVVDTVPLYIHEKIDPVTLVDNISKSNQTDMVDFFESTRLPYHKAVEFYKHEHGWSNRMIAGDSKLAMNSFLEHEHMSCHVQMVYFDPPYGINFNSNFQNKTDDLNVKGKETDLSREPQVIKAFRDTWELGIHSYLSYIRGRIKLIHELLHESGSIFVQIGNKNSHFVRLVLDEIFTPENFISEIIFQKTTTTSGDVIQNVHDTIFWYAKNSTKLKHHKIYRERTHGEIDNIFKFTDKNNGMTSKKESNKNKMKRFSNGRLTSSSISKELTFPYIYNGIEYNPPAGNHWRVSKDVLDKLVEKNRLVAIGKSLYWKNYPEDNPMIKLTNIWTDTIWSGFVKKAYIVQTTKKAIRRCMAMTTDPGDLVLDPTCGSGTTATVAEELGRRWITCDTSMVAIALARQRLMSTTYHYYKLKSENVGICGGLMYKTVPKTTALSVAYNQQPEIIELYDDPEIETNKKRVSGSFTVETVTPPKVESIDALYGNNDDERVNIGFQDRWRQHLLAVGVSSSNDSIRFETLEPHPATRWIHAVGTTTDKKIVAVSFGPENGVMSSIQVEFAKEEGRLLKDKPIILILIASHFDPMATSMVEQINKINKNFKIYTAIADKDLIVGDLKKPSKNSKNALFHLIGQPEIEHRIEDGKHVIEVLGYDYINPATGEIESGDTSKIAMWMLDTDYDGQSVYPRQVFFPMKGYGGGKGWEKLIKNLKGIINEDLARQYQNTISLPFESSEYKQAAIKIIDEAGTETLKIVRLD